MSHFLQGSPALSLDLATQRVVMNHDTESFREKLELFRPRLVRLLQGPHCTRLLHLMALILRPHIMRPDTTVLRTHLMGQRRRDCFRGVPALAYSQWAGRGTEHVVL